MVLERGPRHLHTDFRQSMDVELLSRIYGLVQGDGAQIVVGNGVGGGSNLYLAASLRSPSETFERRDHRPEDGPDRRMWPAEISRAGARPLLRARRAGAPRPAPELEAGREVRRPLGGDADRGRAHLRPRAGRDRPRTAASRRSGATRAASTPRRTRSSRTTSPRPSRSASRCGPNYEAELIKQSASRPYRYVVTFAEIDNEGPNPTRQPTGNTIEVECKVLILSAGAMGNSPLLMRSRPALPGLSAQLGKNVGINGDHIAGDRVRRAEGQGRARPARLRTVLQGQPHHDDEL